MSLKRQLTLHLDADVAGAIEAEGKRRGLNLSRAANNTLRRTLIAELRHQKLGSVRRHQRDP